MNDVIAHFRATRVQRKMAQADFAELSGYDRAHIAKLETGRAPGVKLQTVIDMAQALGQKVVVIPDNTPPASFWLSYEQAVSELRGKQKDVCRLTVLGMTCEDIAKELDLNLNTVKSYRSRILQKFGVRNAIELVHTIYQLKGG